MNKYLSILMVVLMTVIVTPAVRADDGDLTRAKELVLRAAAYLRENGADEAFQAFSSGDMFNNGELYVFVYDNSGTCLSIGGGFDAQIGMNLINAKDKNGVYFIKEIVSVKDAGVIKYKWLHPITKKITDKISYVVRVGDVVLGVGTYGIID